jgi:methyl-accepting chemotaxis protein
MDEILFVKDSLEAINMSNNQMFESLLSELNGEMRGKLNQVMDSAQQMKFREDQINQIIDKTALMTKQQKRAIVLNKGDNFNINATC